MGKDSIILPTLDEDLALEFKKKIMRIIYVESHRIRTLRPYIENVQ